MKIKMKSNTTSLSPNDLLQEVLNIVNSSTRKIPAHFTSNGNRTQSFCVDFDISETDEYAMASEAWSTTPDPSIIKIGEDIMLAAFIAIKLGGQQDIPELYEIIIGKSSEELSDNHKQYLDHCLDFGKLRAKS